MIFEVCKKSTDVHKFYLLMYDMAYLNIASPNIKTEQAYERIIGELRDKTRHTVKQDMIDTIDVLLDDETIVDESLL